MSWFTLHTPWLLVSCATRQLILARRLMRYSLMLHQRIMTLASPKYVSYTLRGSSSWRSKTDFVLPLCFPQIFFCSQEKEDISDNCRLCANSISIGTQQIVLTELPPKSQLTSSVHLRSHLCYIGISVFLQSLCVGERHCICGRKLLPYFRISRPMPPR